MKCVFVTISSFDPALHSRGETTDKPSETIPDQVMSIQELLDRSVRGQSVQTSSLVSDEDVGFEMPDFRRMDLTEIDEYKQQAAADIKRLQSELRLRKRSVKDADEEGLSRMPKPSGKLTQQELPNLDKESEPSSDANS